MLMIIMLLVSHQDCWVVHHDSVSTLQVSQSWLSKFWQARFFSYLTILEQSKSKSAQLWEFDMRISIFKPTVIYRDCNNNQDSDILM